MLLPVNFFLVHGTDGSIEIIYIIKLLISFLTAFDPVSSEVKIFLLSLLQFEGNPL